VEKILVTGAGGFIGSHLTEELVRRGYKVKAFIKYNSRNNWGWLDNSEYIDDIEILTGDIRDYDSVFNALEKCTSVFHLAALIGIPYSYISPLAYIRTNVEGTYNVLQASRERKLGNVIITSTSETYGTAQYIPINEKHPSVGQSPYSASKIAADQLAVSYFRSFALPVKIVRPFNTYGPRQSARAVIPSVIIQAASGSKTIRLGNLEPTRDLTYVDDCVNGFFEVFKSSKLWGEEINIGSGYEISIRDISLKILELMGSEAKLAEDKDRIRPEDSEVEKLICDNTKITNLTNWTPKFSLEEGLENTVKWFENNLNRYKSKIYNV